MVLIICLNSTLFISGFCIGMSSFEDMLYSSSDQGFNLLYKRKPQKDNFIFEDSSYDFNFVNEEIIKKTEYENDPFPHTVIDNFFKKEKVDEILKHINELKDEDAQSKFVNPHSPYEFNKYAFNDNYGDYLKEIFKELNSPQFIGYLEKLTGIKGLITDDLTLLGIGIHRIRINGFLQLHTDFNTYESEQGLVDRRLNLLIYMNPEWKDEYKGALCLCDKKTNRCIKKISPILNRCVIFNTTSKSIHGHPERLSVPDDSIRRQSIAVYYYTKNTSSPFDFEGDLSHSTLWHPSINV
jgi:Rps23 Pro-64 3,4-dihydroxylase Tpa1-like proline 4-hydroxylase